MVKSFDLYETRSILKSIVSEGMLALGVSPRARDISDSTPKELNLMLRSAAVERTNFSP